MSSSAPPIRLYVAEKPSVARDLARVLGANRRLAGAYGGQGIVITWCVGHMAELAPPEAYDSQWRAWRRDLLPMLPERFVLRVQESNAAHWQLLARWLKAPQVVDIVNACDAGREGELIFRYVLQLAGVRRPVLRLWLNALTDAAIRQALRQLRPQADFDNLAAAARCRAEADWLVGLNATRAMTIVRRQAPGGGELCSVGRVQTPTLAMVAARDEAIETFVVEPFYEVWAKLRAPAGDDHPAGGATGGAQLPSAQGAPAAATFAAVAECPKEEAFVPQHAVATPTATPGLAPGATASPARSAAATEARSRLAPTRFAKREQAEATATALKESVARVMSVVPTLEQTPPPPLYDLTALQREANRQHGLTAQQTLQAAQALYEKDKALTYPRTDSHALPQSMREHLAPLLRKLAVAPWQPFVQPLVNALDAGTLALPAHVLNDDEVSDHHAIVPTGKAPAADGDRAKQQIYALVVRRFVAAFCPPARHARTTVRLQAGSTTLVCRGRITVAAGWQAVDSTGGRARADLPALPQLTVGADCQVAQATVRDGKTQPPPPMNEASLLAAMERAGRVLDDAAVRGALKDAGLGTPATRAATIEILKKRAYLRLDGRQLVCTPAGRALIDALPVAALKSAEMTGEWEGKLAEVARGRRRREAFMAEIRREVAGMVQAIAGAEAAAPVGRRLPPRRRAADGPHPLGWQVPADAPCPVCQAPVVLRDALLTCSRGRECTFVIFGQVAGRPLSAAELTSLLARQRVGPLEGFVSRKGRPFAASLQLAADGRVELSFLDVDNARASQPNLAAHPATNSVRKPACRRRP